MSNTGNTQQIIDYGATANDGTGDPLRTAFIKTDENFSNIWAAGPVGSNITIANNTIQTDNTNGNLVLRPNGTGAVQANAAVVPNTTDTRDLGTADRRWRTVYLGIGGINTTGTLNAVDADFSGDVTIQGNLTVEGDTIQIGNITTDTLLIQLANAATTDAQANGAGMTVGINDDIATILYDSANNIWTTNIGMGVGGPITGTSVAVSDATIYGNMAAINGTFTGNVTANYFIGNGSQLTGITSYANANAVAYGEAGWAGNIIPAGNGTQSLGNSTRYWANLWVANNTIYIGGVPLGMTANGVLTVNGNAVLSNDSDTSISTTGNITANYFTGNGSLLTGISTTGDYTFTGTTMSADEMLIQSIDGDITIQSDSDIFADVTNKTFQIQGDAGTWFFDGGSGNLDLPSEGNIVGITPNNAGRIQWVGNSSGDGLGFTTLQLIPDDTLTGGDQYLIIDPTGPTHIHIRAGGTQDDSAAALYLGGEKNFVNVLDNSGVRIQNETTELQTNDYFDPADFTSGTWFTDTGLYYIQYTSTNAQLDSDPYQDINEIFVSWNSGSNSSYLTYGGATQSLGGGVYKVRVNEAPPAEPQALEQISYILNVTRNSYATLTNHNFEVSADNAVGVVGKAGIQLTSQNSTDSIRITTDNLDDSWTWEFGVDGNLTAPGNITATANVTAAYFIGDGSQLTGLPAQYGDSNVATFLAAYGSNTISTTGTITAGNFIGSGTDVELVAQTQQWTFDTTGNLTLPGNTFAVNYANGTAVSLAGTYGNANVVANLAALSTNPISTTGNVTASYFIGDGSQLTAVEAATVDVTNTNGLTTVYYPTFVEARTTDQIVRADVDLSYRTDTNTLTVGNISSTGNITAGNLVGNISITGNVQGTSANVTLVAGSYSTVFDNTGTATFPGNIVGNTAGFAIGYRDIPQVSFTGNATLAATDAGKHYYSTLATANTLTIANNGTVSWPVGTAITVVNRGTGNITVAQGSGVSLYLAGNSSAGNRTVTTYGMATLLNVAANVWMINGTGVV